MLEVVCVESIHYIIYVYDDHLLMYNRAVGVEMILDYLTAFAAAAAVGVDRRVYYGMSL